MQFLSISKSGTRHQFFFFFTLAKTDFNSQLLTFLWRPEPFFVHVASYHIGNK